MEPIDQVVFSKKPKKVKGKLSIFPEAARFIKLRDPFANSSYATGKDLLTVQTAIYISTEYLTSSVKKHDKDPSFSIKFGLDYDKAYMQRVMDEAAILISEQKNKFNRPRPVQLAPYFGLDFTAYKSKTANTPSYPSGHTTQAYLMAYIYADKYPAHRKNLLKAAEECGTGRISVGLHYPSDHKAGIQLAKRLFKSISLQKNENTFQYDTVFNLSPKK
jgi:hypothetical protein